jgi:hypothetical protein
MTSTWKEVRRMMSIKKKSKNTKISWYRVNGRRTRSFKKTSLKITRSSKEKYLEITMND